MSVIKFITGLGILFVFVMAFSYPFMEAWNMSIPYIFEIPEINFVQAIGIMFTIMIPKALIEFLTYLLTYNQRQNKNNKLV